MSEGPSPAHASGWYCFRSPGMNLTHQLQRLFHQALTGLTPDPDKYAAMVRAAADPKHGDYQFNGALSWASERGRKDKPVVARELIGRLPPNDLLAKAEV